MYGFFWKKKLLNFCLVILFTGVLFSVAQPSWAEDTSMMSNLSNKECLESGKCKLNDFVEFIANFYNGTFLIIGAFALLFFVYGGVMFLISAGNSEKVTQAKNIIVGAIIGLIIVFASYLIVQFVLKSLGVVDDKGRFIEPDFQQSDGWQTPPKSK